MEKTKIGFSTLAEVSAELDRLDALLGVKMRGFDANKTEREFNALMAECESIVAKMKPLYKLEMRMKKEASK